MSWTIGEDATVIELYRRLLAVERSNLPPAIEREISKAQGIDKSTGAIRMRLQNVSAILEEKGQPRLRSLSPLRNYPKQLEQLVGAALPW